MTLGANSTPNIARFFPRGGSGCGLRFVGRRTLRGILAFAPDESLLYVDSSHPQEQVLFVFEVLPSDLVGKKQRFFDLNTGAEGSPDGMKIDSSGNIYCTGPGGLWIFNPGGVHLGTIKLPEIPSNCAWGDTDRKTLYITARSSVYSLRTRIRGLAAGETNTT